MAGPPNLARLNGRSGRFFDAASTRLNRSLEDETLLFLAYVLFLSFSLFKGSQFLAQQLFWWGLLPLLILKSLQLDSSRSPPQISATLSTERVLPIGNRISVIFCAAGVYLLMLWLSTLLQPATGLKKSIPPFTAIEIICFLLVTRLLMVSYTNFVSSFFAVVSVVAGAHALWEILAYLALAPFTSAHYPGQYRLGKGSGIAGLAITYAIFLVASIANLPGVKSFWCRIALAVSAPILLCALLLTQSRSVYLAALAGTAATWIWSSRWLRLAVVAVAVIVGLMFAAIPTIREAVLWRGDSRRPEIWGHYTDLAWKRPWLGYGRTKEIRFTARDGAAIPHPHNLILSAQVRGGVLATGAMVVMLFGGLYYSARYAKLTGQSAPLGIIVTLIVAGMFDYDIMAKSYTNWQMVSFWLPIGISIGAELYVRNRHAGGMPGHVMR